MIIRDRGSVFVFDLRASVLVVIPSALTKEGTEGAFCPTRDLSSIGDHLPSRATFYFSLPPYGLSKIAFKFTALSFTTVKSRSQCIRPLAFTST